MDMAVLLGCRDAESPVCPHLLCFRWPTPAWWHASSAAPTGCCHGLGRSMARSQPTWVQVPAPPSQALATWGTLFFHEGEPLYLSLITIGE